MDAGALLDLLGNENRRRILKLLARKPCYVTEISEHLEVSPKAVIDHLRRLEEAGLVESRIDAQRRKYFHIAQNLRLEVTVAPYGFGMKSAYPASPSLDISTCQHLTLQMSRGRSVPVGDEAADGGEAVADVDAAEISRLAAELDELESVERELSLAQRWVQGRIAGVLDRLAATVDDDEAYLDAEILTAIAGGATHPADIARDVDVPQRVLVNCLQRLAKRGLVRRNGGKWVLADA